MARSPLTAHWGVDDPARTAPADVVTAALQKHDEMYRRIMAFLSLDQQMSQRNFTPN